MNGFLVVDNFRILGREAAHYVGSVEWFHALLDTLTGFILLSLLLPVVIIVFRRIRSRRLRSFIDFYRFQVFNKILRLFLEMGDVDKIDVQKELKPNEELKSPSSHFFYGNLEDILIRLRICFRNKRQFEEALVGKSITDFEGYLNVSERCIEEVDRLIAMLGVVPSAQEELFEFRLLPYLLRDRVLEILQQLKQGSEHTLKQLSVRELVECAETVTWQLDELFQKKRRLVDSMVRYRRFREIAYMIMSVPYVLIYRGAGIAVCRLRGIPYADPWASPLCAHMLRDWREKNHFTLEEAAAVLGMAKRRYRDIEYGYSMPMMAEWEPVKEHLRGEVDYSQTVRTSSS